MIRMYRIDMKCTLYYVIPFGSSIFPDVIDLVSFAYLCSFCMILPNKEFYSALISFSRCKTVLILM